MDRRLKNRSKSPSNIKKNEGNRSRDKSPNLKKQKSIPPTEQESKIENNANHRMLIDKMRKKKENKEAKHKNKISTQARFTEKVDKYEIDMEKVLGKGTYGQVYQAHLIDRPDEIFACKIISKKRLQKQLAYQQGNLGTSILQRLQSEIQTHQQLSQCKHVVKLYDFVNLESKGYYLFMEMCDLDLGKFIKGKGFLSQTQAMDLFKQLIRGYKFLYDHGISHRDLKPQNLMLKGDQLKIADFGFVKTLTGTQLVLRSAIKSLIMAQSLVGSINYIAPDILIAQKQKTKYNPFVSDVWSMGIILYKMLYGKQPYQALSQNELLQIILKTPLIFPSQPKVSQQAINLMKGMIDKDKSTRITFKALSLLVIGEQAGVKQQNKSPPDVLYSQKQRLLIFYNLLITQISFDAANYATLREIGINQYQKYSYRLMTLIHQKRLNLLKSGKDIQPEIKKLALSYNEIFYKAIKQQSLIQSDLVGLLQKYRDCLKAYEEFEMLHQEVQYFLLLLLLLYNLEKGLITQDYVYTVIDKQKNHKMNLKKLQELTKKNLDYK